MLRIYQALKSLCKCEHLKALFITFTKKSMIFLPASSLIKITYNLSLLMGWLREPTATGNLLCQTARVKSSMNGSSPPVCPPLSSSHLTHRRLCSLPSIYLSPYKGLVILSLIADCYYLLGKWSCSNVGFWESPKF